jgi:Domain of unknown function (DUF3883)
MTNAVWSRQEVVAIVDDYLTMLASELAGTPYNKSAHRRALKPLLANRSDQSIEFKHANISAALMDAGFPPIPGYKPRSNYQALLVDVLTERMGHAKDLQILAAADADQHIVVPEVDDILAILTQKPESQPEKSVASEPVQIRLTTNYVEREAMNRSLGSAGERFILNYECARLISLNQEQLAARIEHTAVIRGDHEGYDILSFESTGKERLIEVKTTKYGIGTPFFVTRNEVAVSARSAAQYQLYRLFSFRNAPKLFTLPGAIRETCSLTAANFMASAR